MVINDKVVILTHVYDQVDLLRNFFRWHSELGVDAFLVQDMGSTDGTLELLEELAQQYPIDWFRMEQRDLRQHRFGNTGDGMALLAREKFDPKWLIMCDADEFLVLEHDTLHVALEKAEAGGVTSIAIPCFNMTGSPLPPGGDAVASLSLRIVGPYIETLEQQASGVLPRPYIFVKHPNKSIVLASAFSGYTAGSHGAAVRFGETGEIDGARFSHYTIRGFDKFQQKIRNVETFLKENDHLPGWWAWHWRMWVRLHRSGQLRAEYDAQFVSDDQAKELIESGVCVVDRRLADWAMDAFTDRPTPGPVPSLPAAAPEDDEVVFRDWFMCDRAFELPDWVDASGWLSFAPFVAWLIHVLQPDLILDIAAGDASSCFTFCQALDQSSRAGRCVSLRPRLSACPDQDQEFSVDDAQRELLSLRHRDRLTMLDGGIDAALTDIRDGTLDIVSIDGSRITECDGGTLERLIRSMSDRSVALVHGLPPGPHDVSIGLFMDELTRGRPRFELFQGDGLVVIGVGASLPAALRAMFALSPLGARKFRSIYTTLAAAIPRRSQRELLAAGFRRQIDTLTLEHEALVTNLAQQIETLTREREALVTNFRHQIDALRLENENYSETISSLQRAVAELHRRSLRGRLKILLNRLHLMWLWRIAHRRWNPSNDRATHDVKT